MFLFYVLTKFYILKNSYIFFTFLYIFLYKIDIFMLLIKIFNRFLIMGEYQPIHFTTIRDMHSTYARACIYYYMNTRDTFRFMRVGEKASTQRSIRFSYLQFTCTLAIWEVKELYHIKWTFEAKINAAFLFYEFLCYFEIKRSWADKKS